LKQDYHSKSRNYSDYWKAQNYATKQPAVKHLLT